MYLVDKAIVWLNKLKNVLPVITSGAMCSTEEKRLLALPLKLGWLGIPLFNDISDIKYEKSKSLAKMLREKIISQDKR